MAATEHQFAREFVQGIVASCVRRGEAVGPRLREFRTLQLLLLATHEAQSPGLLQQFIDEIDRVLLGLGHDGERTAEKGPPIRDQSRLMR